MSTPPRAHPPRRLVALVVGALTLSAVVVGLGLSGSRVADGVGLLVSGVPALLTGGLVVREGSTRGHRQPFRILLGAAGVVWGAGQVVLGLQAATAGFDVAAVPLPSPGDVVSALAAPLLLAGLGLMPRATDLRFDRLRTLLDAMLIALAATILVWDVFFRATAGGALSRTDVPTLGLVLLDLGLLSVFVVTAARTLDRGVVVAGAGLLLQVVVDLASAQGGLSSSPRPWVGSAVTCVAWCLAGVGFAMVRSDVLARPYRPRDETRRLMLTASSSVTLLIVALGRFLVGAHELPVVELQVGMLLAAAFLGVLWAREAVRARQSQDLLEELSDQAHTDPLTTLGNRRALTERLDELDAGPPAACGLLTFDLDGFKDVNRLLGHRTGDALLVGVASMVHEQLAGLPATAYRLGGDEFAVVVLGGPDLVDGIADALLTGTRRLGNDVPGVGRVALSASIGVAHLVAGASSGAAAVVALDLSADAMRESKATGRGRVTRYSSELAERAVRRAHVERRLRHVIAAGGVDVHFQPVIEIATGAVVGVEGLARWDDEELGRVSPLEFIGIAEDVGLVPELGLEILRTGLVGFVASGAAARGATIGMNLSTLQLRMPGFAQRVIGMVAAAGLRPAQFVVEVTESVMLHDGDPAVDAVYELAQAGMPVALDDFGTGYSSLAYLHTLPVAVLKIDRAMTISMDTERGLAIARGIVEMGQALGIDIVAEGVETPRQAELVAGLGVPYVQGWLYAPALTSDELRDFLEQRPTRQEHVASAADLPVSA